MSQEANSRGLPASCGLNGPRTVSGLFSRAAATHAKRRAIGASAWRPDFQELEEVSNRIANGIVARGGAPGDRVALLMEHDAPLLGTILGVLKAGCIVTVPDTGAPPARLLEIMKDAAPALLVADAAHEARAAELLLPGCALVSEAELIATDDPRPPGVAVMPETPAFLIYTSGSSGRPKGVVQNHRNIVHTVEGYTRSLGYRAKDRFCLLASPGGGQGVMTLFSAWLNGAAVLPYSLRRRGLGELAGWMERYRVTVLITAASIFRPFARSVPSGMVFSKLRIVRLGAERARMSDLEACRKIVPSTCRFANAFSSSETGNLTIFQCGAHEILKDGELPVGYPNEGKTILIHDEDGNEVAEGESGEIVVRSRYLSPGYWNDVEATRAVFEDLPDSEERIFRTGDRGRWRPDGQLEHLGRLDRRRKVLGNRLDPGEVEASLGTLPEVLESYVTMRAKPGEETGALVAWVVPREGTGWNEAGLREKLGKLLPAHAVPARIERVNRIHRSANGKVDEAAMMLRYPGTEAAAVDEPRTPMERRIAEIWRMCLDRPETGIHEDFFEGSGDSLQAVDLLLCLSKSFGLTLDASALVNHPTIARFAEALETGRMGGRKEPWFRLPKASLLDLRRDGGGQPVLFLPGGYAGENELMVFAKLAPLLDGRHPVCGARLNLHARRLLNVFSLAGLASRIGRAYLRRHGKRVPVVVGECRATTLASLTAAWLARELGAAPPLVLLDPWHPRTKPAGESTHPAGIEKYYRLLGGTMPVKHDGEAHVVCAAGSGRARICREWWSRKLGTPCRLHEVPGDHTSYLREYRKDLAAVLNGILSGLTPEQS